MVAPMAGTGAPDRSGIAADPIVQGAKWHISGWCGGAIPLMVAIIISAVVGPPIRCGGVGLVPLLG